MAIAVVYTPPAMTAEQYKQSWSGGAPTAPPPGLILHTGIGEGADFMTVSIWESREAYESFAPLLKKSLNDMGIFTGEPRILAVHQLLPPPMPA